MEQNEWDNVTDALKKCINLSGILHYNYDARLVQLIAPYSPKNLDSFKTPEKPDYRCSGREESEAAIHEWIKVQQALESTTITTHAQLELEDDNEQAIEEIKARLGEQAKMLVRGVHEVHDLKDFPTPREQRHVQAKALFDVAVHAIKIFQETPTGFVLFPNLIIPDSRVFGGFYGAPWSTFNNRSLRMKFRNINGHFDIHVCTVWERLGGDWSRHPDRRKVGILFTYINPW